MCSGLWSWITCTSILMAGLILQWSCGGGVWTAEAKITVRQAVRNVFCCLTEYWLKECSWNRNQMRHYASRKKKPHGKILQATTDQELKSGWRYSVSLKVGDQVFLLEYQDTKVVLDDKDYFIFRHTSYFKKRRLGSSSVGSVYLAFLKPWVQSCTNEVYGSTYL